MSYYPKPKSYSSNQTYHPDDIITSQDNQGTISLDLSSFVQKSAAVFDSDVFMQQNSLNFNGKVQTTAFSDELKITLLESEQKLENITTIDTTTSVLGTLDLTSCVSEFPNEHVPISKIQDLTSTLVGIQTNLSNISSNDVELASHSSQLATHTDDLSQLNIASDLGVSERAVLDSRLFSAQTDINVLEIASSLGVSERNALDVRLTTAENDVVQLETDVVQLQSDVSTNLTKSDAEEAAYQLYKSSNENEKTQMSADILQNTTDILTQGDEIDILQAYDVQNTVDLATVNGLISSNTIDIAQNSTDISALQAYDTQNTTNLSNANSLISGNTTAISDHDIRISANETTLTSHASTLSTHTSAISSKHPYISSTARLSASLVGVGTVNDTKLSMLSDISTTSTIQSQLDAISGTIVALDSSLQGLDALQDIDLINIPLIQSDISALQTDKGLHDGRLTSLELYDTTNTANLVIANGLISDNSVDISALQTDKVIHDGRLTSLELYDTTNTTNISNLQSSVSTNSTGITALVNSDILHDSQITTLQANIDLKNDLISLSNLLDSSVVFDSTQNDTLQNIISTLDANITTLDSGKHPTIDGANKLQSSLIDMTSSPLQYVDITTPLVAQLSVITNAISTLQGLQDGDVVSFETISDNFDTLELLKLDKTVYDDTIAPQITSILASISTLQGLQDGDVVSFASIQSDISTLQADVSALETDDSAQDILISTLQSDVSALETADSAQDTLISTLQSSVSTLNSYDVAQTSLNTGYTNQLNSHSTSITDLQSNIDAISSKIEPIASHTYDDTINKITHTYDEKTMHIDPLDDSNLMELDLTIASPENGNNYVQKIIINCLEFKSYVNTIKINGVLTEIKHQNGETINLAPIAGYSMITQKLQMLYENSEWTVMSSTRLFYNSSSNTAFVIIPPVITLIGSATITLEINSSPYVDDGATAIDDLSNDISNTIVVSGDTVDYSVLGVYTILYDVIYNGVSAVQKSRVITVSDTINPIVVLNGSSEITVYSGDSYTELGATASDNSTEILTVIIAGDTVDTSILGDYTITYSATDSSSNTHSVGRLIHVITEPVLWSNNSISLIGDSTYGLVDFYSNLPAYDTDYIMTKSFTLSGQVDTFKNGPYTVSCCGMGGNEQTYAVNNVFQLAGRHISFYGGGTNPNSFTSEVGLITSPFPLVWYSNGDYKGIDQESYIDAASAVIPYYKTTTSDAVSRAGEFVDITFPFRVKPISFYLNNGQTQHGMKGMDVIASSDGGSTWDFLGGYLKTTSTLDMTIDIASNNKYSQFRFICTRNFGANNFAIDQMKLYGDVYAL